MRHHYSHCTAMQVNWVCKGWEREALKTCISVSVKLIYIVSVSTGHHWWCPVSSPGPPTPWSTPRAASPLDTWHVTPWHVTQSHMRQWSVAYHSVLSCSPRRRRPVRPVPPCPPPSYTVHIATHREHLLSHNLSSVKNDEFAIFIFIAATWWAHCRCPRRTCPRRRRLRTGVRRWWRCRPWSRAPSRRTGTRSCGWMGHFSCI